MEPPDNEDLLEQRVQMVSVVRKDQLDRPALPDQPDGQVFLEFKAKKDRQEIPERQVSRVLEVEPALLDLPE